MLVTVRQAAETAFSSFLQTGWTVFLQDMYIYIFFDVLKDLVILSSNWSNRAVS